MKKKSINKFRYYFFEPNHIKNGNKTVLIYHGWGGTAEGYLDLAHELSQEGYKVIVPEIIYHDTRFSLDNHFEKETMQEYFWSTVIETIDEFSEFISKLGIHKEDVILVGCSMGGLIANGIFARLTGLFGLANINGSGSFVLLEKLFREMDNRDDMTSEEERLLKLYDPVEQTLCNSSILLIHGGKDKIIPLAAQQDYYKYLLQHKKRSNVEFNIHEDVNHQFTLEMIEEIKVWLRKISNDPIKIS